MEKIYAASALFGFLFFLFFSLGGLLSEKLMEKYSAWTILFSSAVWGFFFFVAMFVVLFFVNIILG